MNELLNDLLVQIRALEDSRLNKCEQLMNMFYSECDKLIKAMDDDRISEDHHSALKACHQQTLNLWREVRDIIYDNN